MITSPIQTSPARPVFIFGISGATWKVIKPLLDKDRIPNIQRLINEGCSGTIQSIRTKGDKHFRPQTAWPCLATSKVPEDHGITQFWHTSDDLKTETMWDIFQQHGAKVGLYGWPMTWPPQKTNGFIIPCHHARDDQTWPKELSAIKELDQRQKKIEREKGIVSRINAGTKSTVILFKYGLKLTTLKNLTRLFVKYIFAADSEERALHLRYAKLELSIDFFLSLYKQWSPAVSNFTSFLVDLVSHRYWRYYDPDSFGETDQKTFDLYSGALEEAYELIDNALGRCLEVMPKDTVVAIVSEHGMSAEVESAEVGSFRYVIQGSRLLKLIGLNEDYIPCPVARWLAIRHREGASLAPGIGEKIKQITVVETGLPLFNVHTHGSDEIIVKFNISHSVRRYQEGNLEDLKLSYAGIIYPFSELARRLGRQRSAMHDKEAVFIISGAGIKKGEWIANFNLLDFAPTILKASGFEVPQTFQGRVLNIFE